MATSDSYRPTRVLHVVRPAGGGVKGHVMQVATGLDAHGFESEIACPGNSDVVESALAAGLAVHPVPISGPGHPLRDAETVLVLVDRIRTGTYDIVHAHGLKAGVLARVAAIVARCRTRVVTVHEHLRPEGATEFERRLAGATERRLAPHTSRFIAVSNSIRRELLESFELDSKLVVTIHDGIDLEPFRERPDPSPLRDRYGLPADGVVFGVAARFTPGKAMDILVEAAVPVLERSDNAWLLLAGDGQELEAVRRQAARTPVSDRILLPGYETDVRGMLAALDVLVSATVEEGLGRTTVEAMAAGLPVISTDASGTGEIVIDGETGFLVEAGKPEALTDAMQRLARDPALRLAMGEAGRDRAFDVFSEKGMLERTAETYREVLCSRSPG